MKTIVSTEAQKNTGFSIEALGDYAASNGSIIGGMVVAHVALKALKKSDSLMVNGAVAVGALAGAMYVSNPFIKLALLGVSAYSTVKVLNIGAQAATAPGTAGLGFLPESVKATIRNFLPTLSGDAGPGIGADDLNAALAAIDLTEKAPTEDLGYAEEVLTGLM